MRRLHVTRGFCLAAFTLWSSTSLAIIQGREEVPPIDRGRQTDAPAVFLLKFENGNCSGTAVGQRVLLTAAYCLTDAPLGKNATVEIGNNRFALECEAPPAFVGDPKQNWALCVSEGKLPLERVEKIAIDDRLATGRETVMLTGYGCRSPGGFDQSLGVFSVGTATVRAKAPIEVQVEGAALCFGDAGGGVFMQTEEGRVLVGVNTRGDIATTSFFASTSSTEFIGWARGWKDEHAEICGIDERSSDIGCVTTPFPPETSADPVSEHADLGYAFDMVSPGESVRAREIKVTVLENETLNQVVNRICGAEPESYFDYFVERTGLSRNERLLVPEVNIPLCTEHWYKRLAMPHNSTLWQLFVEQEATQFGTIRWLGFDAPPGTANIDPLNSRFFLPAFRALNPTIDPSHIPAGMEILLPTGPARATEAQPVVNVQGDITPQLSLSDTELQAEDAGCTPPNDMRDYPYNLTELLSALSANEEAASGENRVRTQSRVILADSGLYGAGTGFLRWSVVQAPAETGKVSFAKKIQPVFRKDEKSPHGTEVASLLLGGPQFARLSVLLQDPPKVMIVPQRIFKLENVAIHNFTTGDSKIAAIYTTERDAFTWILEAAKQGARIVNLSLKTTSEIGVMKNTDLSDNSTVLFVVAAGNGDGRIGGETKKLYPAMYGNQPSVLTVAALDGNAKLATKSNHGKEFVQIAAPGCSVPVVSYDPSLDVFVSARQSGTSIATPLVSFAAALIDSEAGGLLKPSDIKRRLLASADLHLELSRDIEDGRVLNVAKAAAIWTDVIQVKPSGPLLIGNLTFKRNGQSLNNDSILKFVCEEEEDVSIRVHNLRKLSPNYRRTTETILAKVYFHQDGLGMLRRECKPKDVLRISIKDAISPIEQEFDLSEVVDIVPRLFREDDAGDQ
ncbi:S8 family serine peptidase [Sinorhizobium meliloti]|nr:S8 family serine peptidase [Sinorhizobium meliloti]MDW9877657.1 S8 family serine peptidase [Sinorhizobium meliloti]